MSSAYRSLTTISKIDPSHSLTVSLYFSFLITEFISVLNPPSLFVEACFLSLSPPPLKHSMRVGTPTSWAMSQAPDIGLGGRDLSCWNLLQLSEAWLLSITLCQFPAKAWPRTSQGLVSPRDVMVMLGNHFSDDRLENKQTTMCHDS